MSTVDAGGILTLDNTPPGSERFTTLCTPLAKSGSKRGLTRDRSMFFVPEVWIAVLLSLLEPLPDLHVPGGTLHLWQMLMFSEDEWVKGGLRTQARRPLRRALLDAELNLDWSLEARLTLALHEACLPH